MERIREIDLRNFKEIFKDTAKYIIIGIIALILFIYIISFQQVIGPSMTPNYLEGEIFLLNKIKYKIFDIKRFDVVVLESTKSKYMIKRVIGLPGESIEYIDNKLYIDGKYVEEDFDKNGETANFNTSKFSSTIPEGHYFVVGDNRINSEDSRVFGFVAKEDIIGKVEFRVWPIIK